ncbi:MAG: LysR substrate-binding domain-containing protein [Qingshengfaniella sp.]
MDDRINIRHIRHFLEVARQQSVSRASETLGTAQPAVTRTLNELETIVGAKLLIRNRRGSHLTTAGEEFYRQVSTGMDQLISAYQSVSSETVGTEVVRMGALPTASAQFVPGVIVSLRRRGYGATIRVLQASNRELLGLLLRGEIQVVLGRLGSPEDMAGLAFEHLFNETLECTVRNTHPLAQRARIPTAEIARHPLVMNVPGTIVRTEVDRQFQSVGVTAFRDVVETNSVSCARQLTLMEDRVWIAPRGVVEADYRENRLVKVDLRDWQMRGPVGMSTNPKIEASTATKQLIDEIRRQAQPFHTK